MNPHHPRHTAVPGILVATLIVTGLLAACGSDTKSSNPTAAVAAASIDVSSVWARTSPTVGGAGAVYLSIANTGGLDDALVAVHVDPSIAMAAGLHETVPVDATASTMAGAMTPATTASAAMPTTSAGGGSMMEMRPVERIVVPAKGSVALAPGGYHIMLTDLVEPLTVGSTLKLTLSFEHSGDKVVTADVRDTAP